MSIVAPTVPGTTLVSTYVNDALLQAMVIGFDQLGNIPDAMSQLVLRRLTRMIASWANDTLLSCYATNEETFTMTAGTASYSTSLLASGRPASIDSMYVKLSNIDFEVTMRDQQWYDGIPYKIAQGIPENCYYNAGMPNGTFFFYPTPYAAFTCYVERRDALNKTTTLTLGTGLSLPPGYDKAIVDALAVDIFPSLKGSRTPIPEDLKEMAREAKRLLRVMNFQPIEMRTPLEVDQSSGTTNGFPYRAF